MGVEATAFFEVQAVVRQWSARNQQLLPIEVKKKGIGVTESLYGSFRDNVKVSGTTIKAEQKFDESGRYSDMGAGRSHSLETTRMKRAIILEAGDKLKKGRTAKKWMRLMYARLNALQGVVGIKVMESAAETVKGPLTPGGGN